jgi:hypothetical protein
MNTEKTHAVTHAPWPATDAGRIVDLDATRPLELRRIPIFPDFPRRAIA